MNKGWFRSTKQLDDSQKAFIKLPPHGRYSLVGPPGSGKTNLLLLRAEFMAGTGEKNVLVITYTRALADFIRSGISALDLIAPSQVKTFHSWAAEHIFNHIGKRAIPKGTNFDEAARAEVLAMLKEANRHLPSPKLYSAIFVDEAQDLAAEELEALLCLSDNVCICGDDRQGIYYRDGLSVAEKLGLQEHSLSQHWRIGQAIARVADKLMPPLAGCDSLESTSNYDPQEQGESTADMHPPFASRDEQFEKMLELVRIQLDAFNDESIGVFCGSRETREELKLRFDSAGLGDKVYVHGLDDDASFTGDRRIHVLTMHGAKGTEFRAVHLFATEELAAYPFKRTKLAYTAITRARTALNAYRTGETSKAVENAFAKPTPFDLDDLLPGE